MIVSTTIDDELGGGDDVRCVMLVEVECVVDEGVLVAKRLLGDAQRGVEQREHMALGGGEAGLVATTA